MRKDMKKVIVDAGKDGWVKKLPKPKFRVLDREDAEDIDTGPVRGTKKGLPQKNVGDDLSPLWRFLKSRVGQPWNNIYAEISAQADTRSTVGAHLREHVRYMVTYPGKPITSWESMTPHRGFWVDDAGILQYTPEPSYRYASKPSTIIEIGDHKFHCHEGKWYEVLTGRPDAFLIETKRRKIWNAKDVFGTKYSDLREKYRADVFCVWKRSANSKEIKKIKAHFAKTAAK